MAPIPHLLFGKIEQGDNLRPHIATFCFLSLLMIVPSGVVPDASASWTPDGLPVTTTGLNFKPSIISDGAGGSILAWHGGSGTDIFSQRLLSDGTPGANWPTSGPLGVCSAAGLQEYPVLVSDLAGGALIFWQDARSGSNYDIYGQHITGAGQVSETASSNWLAGGLPISDAANNQYAPMAVSDGLGGAILVWQDLRRGAGNYDIYAQRVDGDGNLLWGSGLAVCAAANNQINPTIVPDGANGAFIAWQDYRKGNEYDIYLQHIAADGGTFPDQNWRVDGKVVCGAANSQYYPVLAIDGAGGVFVAWQDYRSGSDNHIYAQHLSAGGAVVADWLDDGRPVCQAQYSQYYPVIAHDGGTGVYLAWQDYRSGTSTDIYAEHLTAGNSSWGADGVAMSTAANSQFSPQIAPDGGGGAFVTWHDSRGGTSNDIYVQQVNVRGVLNPLWDGNGEPACLAPNSQQFPVLTSSGRGTAIITWQDQRTGDLAASAIYAQQALGAATSGVGSSPALVAALSSARPNPFRSSAQFQLTLPSPGHVSAEVLDITGRRVATLASRGYPAGVHTLVWDGNSARGGRAAPGVYLVRVHSPGLEKTQRVVRLQ